MGAPTNKTVQVLLSLKADNILLGLGWVITDDIRAASHVLLRNGKANLIMDVESLRGCM